VRRYRGTGGARWGHILAGEGGRRFFSCWLTRQGRKEPGGENERPHRSFLRSQDGRFFSIP